MILVVNMIPQALSGETNQDSEPNLAVNHANPLQIAGSAFTPDPMGGENAPIFVSNDGGNTWLLNSIVPSQPGKPYRYRRHHRPFWRDEQHPLCRYPPATRRPATEHPPHQ